MREKSDFSVNQVGETEKLQRRGFGSRLFSYIFNNKFYKEEKEWLQKYMSVSKKSGAQL